MLTGHIIAAIERFAPVQLQESWDNSGLIIGSPAAECTGVLIAVDVTPAVVQEAIDKGYNLIVSHHPLIFKGLKRLTGATNVELSVLMAVRAGIAIYAAHTSLDSAPEGVSYRMARMLGLGNIQVLAPQKDRMLKLSVFVPDDYVDQVRLALFDAGAGAMGRYDSCSYTSHGHGSFRALEGADPYVGEIGSMHVEPECKLEVVLPTWRRAAVEEALRQTHPYEEPAYEFVMMANVDRHAGLGAVGNFDRALEASAVVDKVKSVFGSPVARCTRYPMDAPVRRVALCGGSGSEFISDAIASGAQVFITSDTRYHDFVDYADTLLIVDIGHFESEMCTKDIFYRIITEKFPNFAVECAKASVNPINYL